MNITKNKFLSPQMYTNDSEAGRILLQSVKENLFEATTKVILYSIEMYTKKDISEWVKSDLLSYLDNKENENNKRQLKDLSAERDLLEEGNIAKIDITNGCAVINTFVRKNALNAAYNELNQKIISENDKLEKLKIKEQLLKERAEQIKFIKISENAKQTDVSSNEIKDASDTSSDFSYIEEEYKNEFEIFKNDISNIVDFEELEIILEKLQEEQESKDKLIKKLKSFQKNGERRLETQNKNETEALDNLRKARNIEYAHKNEDDFEISAFNEWVPEGGPLYKWASDILIYIKTIMERYRIYGQFDDFYASRERKNNFNECKIYVQKQIKNLYVNKSDIVFEFAGNLYDKSDDKYNFKKLIEDMAYNWDTGIRYLTVVTNEDMPELNIFFKECLSGTSVYVNSYLIDRNELRSTKDPENKDYIYFKLLYHLNPAMEKIYWKGNYYSKEQFAKQIIYKFIKVRNKYQFEGRLKDFEKYLKGIDINKWCEYHLLSEIYFAGLDDINGQNYAKNMENAIIEFNKNDKSQISLYQNVIKSAAELYFYMSKEHNFFYTKENGRTLCWKSLKDACDYMEDAKNFSSFSELYSFINELNNSTYFTVWKNQITDNINNEDEV